MMLESVFSHKDGCTRFCWYIPNIYYLLHPFPFFMSEGVRKRFTLPGVRLGIFFYLKKGPFYGTSSFKDYRVLYFYTKMECCCTRFCWYYISQRRLHIATPPFPFFSLVSSLLLHFLLALWTNTSLQNYHGTMFKFMGGKCEGQE